MKTLDKGTPVMLTLKDAFICFIGIVAVVLATYYFVGWALGAEKVREPVVEPGWIFCMGPEAHKYRVCRMFLMDGPPPKMIEEPKQ